jgi:hypothetical protein
MRLRWPSKSLAEVIQVRRGETDAPPPYVIGGACVCVSETQMVYADWSNNHQRSSEPHASATGKAP